MSASTSTKRKPGALSPDEVRTAFESGEGTILMCQADGQVFRLLGLPRHFADGTMEPNATLVWALPDDHGRFGLETEAAGGISYVRVGDGITLVNHYPTRGKDGQSQYQFRLPANQDACYLVRGNSHTKLNFRELWPEANAADKEHAISAAARKVVDATLARLAEKPEGIVTFAPSPTGQNLDPEFRRAVFLGAINGVKAVGEVRTGLGACFSVILAIVMVLSLIAYMAGGGNAGMVALVFVGLSAPFWLLFYWGLRMSRLKDWLGLCLGNLVRRQTGRMDLYTSKDRVSANGARLATYDRKRLLALVEEETAKLCQNAPLLFPRKELLRR